MSHRIKPMTIICLVLVPWKTKHCTVLYFPFSSATLLRRYRQVRVITAGKRVRLRGRRKRKKTGEARPTKCPEKAALPPELHSP
ncbi:hypothetical protein V8C43DRAFT_110869 [Trichoderma afarasin]